MISLLRTIDRATLVNLRWFAAGMALAALVANFTWLVILLSHR